MIEGFDHDAGATVLLNPGQVIEVYSGGERQREGVWSSFWCNVKTTSGKLHRFKGSDAEKVYAALRQADLGAFR